MMGLENYKVEISMRLCWASGLGDFLAQGSGVEVRWLLPRTLVRGGCSS